MEEGREFELYDYKSQEVIYLTPFAYDMMDALRAVFEIRPDKVDNLVLFEYTTYGGMRDQSEFVHFKGADEIDSWMMEYEV